MTNVEVGSVREIHQRLSDEGYRISQHALRLWIKQGTLHAIYTGNKALISYASVLDLLNSA